MCLECCVCGCCVRVRAFVSLTVCATAGIVCCSLPVRSAYSYVLSSADSHTRTQHADLRCECLFWNVMCVLCVPVFAFVSLFLLLQAVCVRI